MRSLCRYAQKDSLAPTEIAADKYIAYSEVLTLHFLSLRDCRSVLGGKMIMGKAFADTALLDYAKSWEVKGNEI